MNQHIKNTNTYKTPAGSKSKEDYCEDKSVHPDQELTTRRSLGLTTTKHYLRDIGQLRSAYQYLNRFTPGKQKKILDDWLIVTDAPGVVLSRAQFQKAAVGIFKTLGPGLIGMWNEHIKTKPQENGVIPGPDGNYSLSSTRRVGPFLIRRRDSEKSEYRRLRIVNEVVRFGLQTQENVCFPDMDSGLEKKRKAQNKRLRAEELAEVEWEKMEKRHRQDNVDLVIDFASSESVLANPENARKALQNLGYKFEPKQLPASLSPHGDPMANHFFRISHPDWETNRQKNAKKPVKPNARRPEITIDLIQILVEGRRLVREMHRKYVQQRAEVKRKATQIQASTLAPASEIQPETALTRTEPAVKIGDSKNQAEGKSEPIVPRRPEFHNDEFLVPAELIRAVENLPPRQLLRNPQKANDLLATVGWPVVDEMPQPNELILNHGGQIIRLRQDETLFALQQAIHRKNLRHHPDWSKHADLNVSANNRCEKVSNLNSYLDPFHPDLLAVEEAFETKSTGFAWLRASEYTARTEDPVQTSVNFINMISKVGYSQMAEIFLAIHFRTNATGFFHFATQVRQRLTRKLQELAFITDTPPAPIPSSQSKLDWEDEEKVLAWLHQAAKSHYHDLKKPNGKNDFNMPEKLLIQLGLRPKENKQEKTIELSHEGKAVTLPQYRFCFAVESGFTNAECESFGLVMPPYTPPPEPITKEGHDRAQNFAEYRGLKNMWRETRDKLQHPAIQAALTAAWPQICEEMDDQKKAKKLMDVLQETGKLIVFEPIRLAFALLDPMAARFSTIGPKALNIEKECQPKTSSKTMVVRPR